MNAKNKKSQRGMGMIGAVIAGTASLVAIAGFSQLMLNSQSQKQALASEIDAATVQSDIKNFLSDSSLCDTFFAGENATFDSATNQVRIRLGNGEFIDGGNNLVDYALDEVSLTTNNTVQVGSDAGITYFSTELLFNAKKRSSGLHMRPRSLGTVFISTNSSDAPTGCNMDSVTSLLNCPSGQVKISDGVNSVPSCKTPAQLIGKLCPAGKMIVAGSSSVQCLDPPTASTTTTTTTTTTCSPTTSGEQKWGSAYNQLCTSGDMGTVQYRMGRTVTIYCDGSKSDPPWKTLTGASAQVKYTPANCI